MLQWSFYSLNILMYQATFSAQIDNVYPFVHIISIVENTGIILNQFNKAYFYVIYNRNTVCRYNCYSHCVMHPKFLISLCNVILCLTACRSL